MVAAFSNAPSVALLAIGGGVLYAMFTLTVVRKFFAYVNRKVSEGIPAGRRFEMPSVAFGLVLFAPMLAAYTTDAIGIYAVFGAFLLGTVMPKGKFSQELDRKIEPLTVNLFLPLFFIYAGLSTQFSLLFEGSGMVVTASLLILSIIGKFAACSISAYAGGETKQSALCIGALMNARGLMELILLNIGLERGLITQHLYTALVIMAIVTTVMATPIFNAFYRRMDATELAGQRQADDELRRAA